MTSEHEESIDHDFFDEDASAMLEKYRRLDTAFHLVEEGDLVVKGEFTLWENALKYIASQKGSLVILILDSHRHDIKVIPWVCKSKGDNSHNIGMVYYGGPMMSGGVEYKRLVVVYDEATAEDFISELVLSAGEKTIVISNNALSEDYFPSDDDLYTGLGSATKPIFYRVNDRQLVELARCNRITFHEKILSCLAHMFPYISRHLIKHARQKTYTSLVDKFALHAEGYQSNNEEEVDLLLRMVVTILSLVSSYSQENMMSEQIMKRGNAARADRGELPFDSNQFKDCFVSIGVKAEQSSGVIAAALGFVLKLSHSFEFVDDVADNELADNTAVGDEFELTEWNTSIRKQMLMVYDGAHLSTIRFMFNVYDVISSSNLKTLDVLNDEVSKVETALVLGKLHKFIGLRFSQHDSLTVSNFPHYAYLGLLYHGRMLASEAEKENWKNYKVQNIGNHIHGENAKHRLERFLTFLPSPSLIDLASMADYASYKQMEFMLKQGGGNEHESLFEYMTLMKKKGPWYDVVNEQHCQAEWRRYRAIIVQNVQKQWEAKKASLSMLLTNEESLEKRKEISNNISMVESKWMIERGRLEGSQEVLPASSDPSLEFIRAEAITLMDSLLTLINMGEGK